MTATGPLVLRNSRIQDNRLFAEVGSSEEVGYSGGALDMSHDGQAAAGGAVYSVRPDFSMFFQAAASASAGSVESMKSSSTSRKRCGSSMWGK
jgi:hypothetical protein